MSHTHAIIKLLIQNVGSVWTLSEDRLSCERKAGSTLTLADPWQVRQTFMRLRSQPELLLFLNAVGSFFDGPDSSVIEHYWNWQEVIRRGIIEGPASMEKECARLLPAAFQRQLRTAYAGTRFRLDRGMLALELTVHGTLPGIVKTIEIDHLRGLKFRICERRDCRAPYPVRSKHRRKYCSPQCAHLVSVRKSRSRNNRRDRKTNVE
jgi:hypothetical protein